MTTARDSLDLDLAGIDVDAHKIITCTLEGIIDEDDLRELALGEPSLRDDGSDAEPEAPAEVEDPADLKRIREKHHSVARLIAQGLSQSLVAQFSGYTSSYLSILLNNPSMQELVGLYRSQLNASAEVIGENLRRVGGKALEALEKKIDAGEANSNELIQTAKLGFDRSGHGPSSSQKIESTSHVIDHAKIAALSNAARAGSKQFTIPVEDVRQPALPAPEDTADAEVLP